MDSVQPLMRLKVKADTFFLPDEDGSVYFRNNAGSFRMTGASIQSWIEKLMPAFDGQHTLADLTDGLPAPYQERIYDLAGILYDNGFVRDTSQDQPHHLPQHILADFAPQIEFVDNIIGSGAARFEAYRNTAMLAIGSGQMLVSLVRALLESGVSTVHFALLAEEEPTMQQLTYMAAMYGDDESPCIVDVMRESSDTASLQAVIRRMDTVFYTSESGDMDTLRRLESVCTAEETLFCPVLCVDGIGIAGPVAQSGESPERSRWDSAWHRIHASLFEDDGTAPRTWSATAGSLLANTAVFALFKLMTGIDETPVDRFYTLHAETLEGVWHDFIPAANSEFEEPAIIKDWETRQTKDESPTELADVLSWFAGITHPVSGLFHAWDEGELPQLPLSQCRVQPIDPRSAGPAELLDEMVCAGLSHEDARLEAGLTGIEAYVRQAAGAIRPVDGADGTARPGVFLGVGAGVTAIEAMARALNACLAEELRQAVERHQPEITLVQLHTTPDEACTFYLEALRTAGMEPVIGMSQDRFGLPVVWMQMDNAFVGSIGMSLTSALQRVLSYALLQVSQTDTAPDAQGRWLVTARCDEVHSNDAPVSLAVPAWDGYTREDVLSAVNAIRQSGQDIRVLDLTVEPFLKDVLTGVIGVSICEGGAP